MGIEELAKLTPRELQLLMAQKVERMADVDLPEIKDRLKNGDVVLKDHEGRLRDMETEKAVKKEYGINGFSKKKKAAIAVGSSGGLTAVVMTVLGAGKVLGWW